jgi:quinol monooxygenase YgiN
MVPIEADRRRVAAILIISYADNMATIAPSNPVVTLVNVFRLHDPGQQQRLVDLLVEATERTMKHQPGYVSANIHRSLDGTHVANYAQWRSQADLERMWQSPDAQVHMRGAFELADVEGHLYEVVCSDEA